MSAAVGRSWVMETRGDYQADASADDTTADATPEKVVPMRRGFYMTDNDYVDRLAGVIDGRTGWVLTYILRQTVGFHRREYKCSQYHLAKVLGYARNSIAAALRELEALHVVTSDADSRLRTQTRTLRLEPIESWTLPVRCDETSSNFELVETSAENELDPTSSKNELYTASTSSNFEQRASQTSSNFEHAINIEDINTSEVKDNETDANASGHGVDTPASGTPPSSPEKKSGKPRKERRLPTPEEEYRAALIASVKDVRDGEQAPNHGQEWKAAGDFYRMQAPLETVIACYREEMRRPTWDTKYLSLMSLKSNYGAFVRSGVANYRTAIDRARAAAAGKYDAPRTRQNGHAPPTSPAVDATEDALTRKGIETRERLRRMREEEAAAAKGVQS